MFAVFSPSEDNELRKICKETGFRRKNGSEKTAF